ncbi:MAG TPA: carboxypeptidase-like regulatory domain-containing protein, partial [Acidobacteriaceae bacterium]|nr:carboxypeptidase-like regulatory domain-containing protein [Acidobacteriaceae bacterium]
MHPSSRRGISTLCILFFAAGGFVGVALPAAHAQAAAKPHSGTPQAHSTAAQRVQSAGNAGTVTGTVTDASGALVPGATVTLSNAVSGLSRTVTADSSGVYTVANLPFNTYHLSISAAG